MYFKTILTVTLKIYKNNYKCKFCSFLQWQPENSEIGKQLLDSNFDIKYSNEYETQQLCSVSRPFSLISDLICV